MSLFRETAEFALDHETQKHIDEQMAWITREPGNPKPYFHLGLLYRMQWKHEEGFALLLEAVRLEPKFADAHAALVDVYVVRQDYPAAWRHARLAAENGNTRGVELLSRHGIAG